MGSPPTLRWALESSCKWLTPSDRGGWQTNSANVKPPHKWCHDSDKQTKTTTVHHVDAHIPKSRANKEHRNNEQVDQGSKIEMSKIDLDWQHKGELFLAQWAHDASGHQGRDATYKWAQDRGVDLTMDSISQVIHDCDTCAAIKQAKQVKPLWYGGQWSKYRYGEAWQIDYIALPQTRQEGSCDSIKSITEIQKDHINWLPLINQVRGLQLPGSSFLPFLKTGAFASFQLTWTSPDSQDHSKLIERGLTITSVSSLSTLDESHQAP
ncbi:hypothetical protein HGM15179_019537 [Zosterops borbonicus]|uniref:Integrase zinc-binding domain-containing protein n=1 Tax=Zosterops borbonicus TaxID=364589 RepID=A0A8K1D9J6_9PASS|nr:hypothetical protein HGM15179_019537 [Zosterops borbonicus]